MEAVNPSGKKALTAQNQLPETEKNDGEILVSISSITYNHAAYLAAALDSFLAQDCGFSYEILIHDDASTDGTADIIRAYAARYPDIIRPILQTENQYSKGIRNVSGVFNFPRARGKYIAMCEGDDFWCDREKLRLQIDFMEAHPDCALSCHAARIMAEDGAFREKNVIRPYCGTRMLSPAEVISKPVNFPTASLVFRTEAVRNLPDWYYHCPVGDIPLQLALLRHGSVYYFDREMSVYRMGSAGSWGESMEGGGAAARTEKWQAHFHAMEALYLAFNHDTDGRYAEAVREAIARCRFQVDLKCGRLTVLEKPENKKFLGELAPVQRRLLLLENRHPGLYAVLQRTWSGLRGIRQKNR